MAVRCFLVWLLVSLLALVAGQQHPLQYGRRGLQTTLAPLITAGPPEKIRWKHGARKVVEFDGSEENVYGTFLDRVVLDWHTAELTIKDLQGSDSGVYELEATVNRKTYYSKHELAVIDKVAVPTITCLINGTDDSGGDGSDGDGSDPRSLAELRCSAEGPPSLVTYDWMLVSGVRGGAALAVALRGEQDDMVYKCRATNPVSEETGTFVAKDCYPDNFPYTGLIIGVVAICLLLVLVACFWCYRKWKKAHPKPNDIRDVEKQPWHPTQGPAGGTHDEDKERESLLYNGSTLPSTQPLSHLAQTDQDTRPLDSTSEQEEDTTKDGRLCNSSQVSVHLSETNLPSESESQHHPADLETKCSGEDSVCEFEEESKSNLPQAASPGGCSLHPVVVTERSATQTPERTSDDGHAAQAPTEPEEQQVSGTPGTPGTPRPSDQSASEEDGEAERLAYMCLEDPQSSVLKTTDGTTATTNPGPSPSPLPPPETSASDTRSNTPDITTPLPPPPQPQTPPEEHLGSDNKGCKEEAGSSEPTMPEPAAVAVALKEEKDAPGPRVPLNIVGSPEEEEEERSDTWVESCVGDEPSSDECVVAISAATNLQVNVEAPAPKVTEEEEVNYRKLPHGDATELPEEGEEEEGDGKDRGVAASLSEPASEPVETFRDSEESDTVPSTKNKEDTCAGTPEDNHYHLDNVTDVTRQGVVLRAEPEKEEEETVHDDTEVQAEGEEDEGGREGGTTGLTGMEMEPPGPETQRRDSEPGERSGAAGQEGTEEEGTGRGRTHEETKCLPGETNERPLSETPDGEEVKRSDANETNGETNTKTEAVPE